MVYSSRSRLETFGDCDRYGYLKFLYEGRGISRRGVSVYLATGSYTHIGLEIIFKNAKAGYVNQKVIQRAVEKSQAAYVAEIERRGFDLEEDEDRVNEQYVVTEQCALVEAFLRSFYIRVLPDLLTRFRIINVEKEEVVDLGGLVMQAKIDVCVQERQSNDIYIFSFKTAAQWDRRQEKQNEHDNQGLSETWALEHRLKEKFGRDIKVMGVIMIYFLKGKRYETVKGSHKYEQHCPLIRGYRKLIGADYEYAPSLWYHKPQNASGWGKLGKGWEPFTVWDCEDVGGVKGWIDKLCQVSPSGNFIMGQDVIGESFKIPAPYMRNQDHIASWIRQATATEQRIALARMDVDRLVSKGMPLSEALDYYFPQRRRGCHYPTDCEMLQACYTANVLENPVGSGIYVYRKPHHEAELKEHEGKWGGFDIHPMSRMEREVRQGEQFDRKVSTAVTPISRGRKAELININLEEVLVEE